MPCDNFGQVLSFQALSNLGRSMEQDTKVTNYEIKRSKNGFDIPVINGVHLHSAYNPQKEATHFYEKYKDQINANSPILILGLGFGYHIEALFEYLENKQKPENIWVLEPSIETVEKYKKINPEIFSKFRLICENVAVKANSAPNS